MWIFGKPKKPSKKPRKTLADKDKELELKQKKFTYESFLNLAKSDPNIKKQMVMQHFNIDLKAEDPIEAKKREIDTKIIDRALEKIDKDPELTERFVDAKIESIIGEGPRRRRHGKDEDSEEEYGSGPFSQVFEELDAYEMLKERLGGEKGALGGLVTPEVIQSLIENVLAPLLAGRLQLPPPKTFVVETPEGKLEMGQERYVEYLKAEQAKKLVTAPPPRIVVSPKAPDETKGVGEQVGINIVAWLPYLDKGPEVFITELLENSSLGDKVSEFTVNFLRSKTADEVIESLQPFKENDMLREAIEKIEGNREWLVGVINGLKMVMGEASEE